jgi:hypothetical protein
MILSCQGTANNTLPSSVCGTRIAACPGQKILVEDKVYPLARRNHRLGVGIVQPKDAVGEDAGSIDDYLRTATSKD